MVDVIQFLEENWQWFVLALGVPTLFGVMVKMCFKLLFPIKLKVFSATFNLGHPIINTPDGPITPIIVGSLQGRFSIMVIRKPRLDEFHEFFIEIPQLGIRIDGDCADLIKRDMSPQRIEFTTELFNKSEQKTWQSITKGTKILIKVKAGWRHSHPVTKQVILS